MGDKAKDPRKTEKLTRRQIADKRSTLTKQADQAIEMLAGTLDGSITPTKLQMDACKLVLAKTMPDLKSIEQTNKTEQRKPEETKAMLQQLLKDNPLLLAELLGKGVESTKQNKDITSQPDATKH